jgi:hypothetical protein
MRRVFLVAAVLMAGAGTATAGDSPIDFLQRLFEPPKRAVTEVFRPRPASQPKPPAPDKADAATDLLSVPMPRLRPGDGADESFALGYAPAALPAAPLVPSPHLRPGDIPASAMAAPEPAPSLVKPPPAAGSTCGVMLARLGVEAVPLAPISEGQCGIASPVAVTGLEGGRVDFTDKAIIGCDLAESVANFVEDTVQPAALRTLGARVTGLRIAASYACRNRDGLADAKLSEHAHGNAIDISAFKVNGRWIDVKTGWGAGGADAEFLRSVRSAACGPFTTVLGPGSDSFHTDHFHLDRAQRRTAGPSKGLYCQ